MMQDLLANYERLASQARDETSPSAEVADRVLATLHSRRPILSAEAPDDAIVGVGSFLAACVALSVLACAVDDPLFVLAQPFITVLQ